MVRAVTEIAFWVKDVEAAAQWYRDILGFEIEDALPGQNVFLRTGELYVVLFNPENPGTQLANDYLARVGQPRGAVYHVAFAVDAGELDTHARSIASKGVDIAGPKQFESGRRSYFLEDLDGHYIELTDR